MKTLILEKKLELAELTLKLANVTKEKWIQLKIHSQILKNEEDLIQEITNKSETLQNIIKQYDERESR